MHPQVGQQPSSLDAAGHPPETSTMRSSRAWERRPLQGGVAAATRSWVAACPYAAQDSVGGAIDATGVRDSSPSLFHVPQPGRRSTEQRSGITRHRIGGSPGSEPSLPITAPNSACCVPVLNDGDRAPGALSALACSMHFLHIRIVLTTRLCTRDGCRTNVKPSKGRIGANVCCVWAWSD